MKTDNELIAEFMGWTRKEPNERYNLPRWYKKSDSDLREHRFMGYSEQLKFHSSWDWLMPVVGKIGDLDKPRRENYETFELWETATFEFEDAVDGVTELKIGNINIEFLHESVVEFIKWYSINGTK